MATYDILNLDETTDYLASFYSMLMPDMNVARGSDNWLRIRALAAGISDAHAHALALFREVWPQTASRAGLLLWANALGITVKTATTSSGEDAIRLVGTVGSAYTAGDVLSHSSGQTFELNETGTIPAAGFVDVDIVSISTGTAANLDAGEILTLDPSLTGITDECELQSDMTGAEDEESTSSLRGRVLARLRDKGKGGSVSDWISWCTDVTGIAEAYAYRHRDGQGTVDVVAMKKGEGSGRFLTAGERTSLLATLNELRPHTVTCRVLECVADAQAIKITVTPFEGEAYERDWNDASPLTVSSYTPATRTLVFTSDRPSDMRAGDRICWDATSGELVEIESLSGTNAVVLKTDPSPAPTGTIYSGGALTSAIQTAVKRSINGGDVTNPVTGEVDYVWGIGPARGVWGGNWNDSLLPFRILSAAGEVEGALDVDVDSPAAGYTPTDYGYPDDDQVPVVTASYVFVKYAST
jgi:hypothetical protein